MPEFELSSIAFNDGQPIPRKYSCEGENVSPPLDWSAPPEGTRSLALIVHDPDAPSGDFTHWVAWNIDPLDGGLDEGTHPPVEGTNGFGENGYGGPCPPPGDGAHRYQHELFALDAEPELEPESSREQLEDAMEGHVLGGAELVGTYERT
jgi:Raf kinase inhibitor-like YbhB/YbcL family protein